MQGLLDVYLHQRMVINCPSGIRGSGARRDGVMLCCTGLFASFGGVDAGQTG